MLSTSDSTSRTVELTDDINEKASILEVFFNVLHGKPILESVGST
jgi:hypothetical protein